MIQFSIGRHQYKELISKIEKMNAFCKQANRDAKKHLFDEVKIKMIPSGNLLVCTCRQSREKINYQYLLGVINGINTGL
jgi:hypothetical protein